MTGYSRGKLFRTELLKTPAGYVARNHLIAVLTMLAADACVTPRGGLVVAAHSGLPDWGSGPQGKGTLYKIEPSDRDAPQPVAAWAPRPQEVHVAFDRPIDPAALKGLMKRASIAFGQAVSPGDRFESLRRATRPWGVRSPRHAIRPAHPLGAAQRRSTHAPAHDRPAS